MFHHIFAFNVAQSSTIFDRLYLIFAGCVLFISYVLYVQGSHPYNSYQCSHFT